MILLNNCHSNSLIPLINKPTRNANNNPSILDHIWTNQLYDKFNGIFLLDITDHYLIFTIAPINCPEWPHRQGGCLACCDCTFDSAEVH